MTLRPSFDPGFSTEGMSALYTPEATITAILRFEAALAATLADAGLAPRDQAEAVVRACEGGIDDAGTIIASTWENGTPILTLREELADVIGDAEASRWFHFGATTQDAIDTGQMIQANSALGLLEADLLEIAHRLRDLTDTYRDHPQMGRTFLQDARTTTFGFRTAGWLDAVLTHITQLRSTRDKLVIQLGGPVGTADAYGEAAPEVLAGVANRLGLGVPDISWHTNRTTVRSLVQTTGRIAATMAKIGGDIALLASGSIGEVTVRSGGSSSMPGKQNPLDAVRAIAAARVCDGAVAMLGPGTSHELDRGVGGWHVEWVAVPLVFQASAAAVEAMSRALDSLTVDVEVMSGSADGTSPGAAGIDVVLAAFERIVSG
jgi:3-carboxy-cis,cis-muconate cycloisomerase